MSPEIRSPERATVERRIGVITATGIVVANMIGAGIFTTSGILAGLLPGPGWVMACWLLGGVIAMAGALCYTELATRMPDEGGEYLYLRRLFHPVLGFLTGWTSLVVGFSVPVAASAVGFAEYFAAGAGFVPERYDPMLVVLAGKGLAIAVIVLFTCLHYLGVRLGGGVQNLLTACKVVIVLSLAGAGLWVGSGVGSGDPVANVWTAQAGGAGPLKPLGLGTAMMLVMFAYSGWNASAYIAGEVKRPRRTLPVSLLCGTAIVTLLYLAINTFIFRVVPYGQLVGVIAVVETATTRTFGSDTGSIFSFLVGIGLLSSLSAFVMIGPRVYFAMSRDGLFFPFAAQVHPRYGVPGKSIVLQGIIAVVMVVAGSFEQLLVYLGFALGIFPLLAVAGLFVARRRCLGEEEAVKVPAYPVVPLFFLAASLTLMVVAWLNRPVESTAAIATVVLGIPCYFLWLRKGE